MQQVDIQEQDTCEVDTSGLADPGPDTSDEVVAAGRHRAPRSALRTMSFRLGLAAVGVLLAMGVGTVAADLVGLSDPGPWPQGAPNQLVPQDRVEAPRPARPADLTVQQEPSGPGSDVLVADPSPELQPQAAGADGGAAPTDAGAPLPAAVPTVRTGNSCPTVGLPGVTARGDAAICTASRGKGPNRWRLA